MVELATITGHAGDRKDKRQKGYLVLIGEVVVTRRGQPVDLVEAGEVVDARFWPGAEFLATLETKVLPLRTYH